VGDEGIPGQGLEFGLTFERGLDEVAEVMAVEVSVGSVEGVDGVEDLHGAEDRDVETFDLLMGEFGSGVGGVLLFAVTEKEEEGGGEEDTGEEDTGDPEKGAGVTSWFGVHGRASALEQARVESVLDALE